MKNHHSITFIFLIFIGGCTTVPRDGEFSSVEKIVNERIPQRVHWYQGSEEDLQVKNELEKLLQEPLTAQSVVQIALLNNLDLQVEYENLGIAQADLVQAGLLKNPVLFASIRFPKGGDGGNNVEFALAKEFLDILMRPARQRVAATEFERVKLRVANAVLDLASETRIVFYRLQGMQQLAAMMKLASDASTASYEIAKRFDEAGNISELKLAQERSAAADMSAEFITIDMGLQHARDKLNKLLGLSATEVNWTLADELPELPANDPDVNQAEQKAIANRLDLAESQRTIDQLFSALEMTRDYRWIGGSSFGVSTERDPDGSRVTGPEFSVEIPIFDQRQAEIARLESLLEQSKSRAEALKVSISNDVRAAVNRMVTTRKLTEYYRDELIPAREQVVKFTQQEQNYMLTDVFELLYARQQQFKAYRAFIETLTEYWVTRTELARAIGVALTNE